MAGKSVPPNDPRRQLKRAGCLILGYRDSLTAEAAARLEPFGKLLEPVSTAMDWTCPPPTGELSAEQRGAIDYARETVAALVAIAKANPSDYAPADLILSEISESLAEAG